MVITYYIGGEPHYLLPNGESITAKQYEALKAATAKRTKRQDTATARRVITTNGIVTTATTTVRHTIKLRPCGK